jgi:tetratricopeptide (TPR) repeat protein
VTAAAAWLLGVVLFAAPSAAVSRVHFIHAQRAAAQHDWRRALEEFTAASEAAPSELPDLWFDIGQCHRNLGHARQAVAAFERYLALKPDAADRAKVRALIASLGGRAADEPAPAPAPSGESAAEAPATADTPSPSSSATPVAPTTVAAPAADPLLAATPAPPPKPRRRWALWTGVAVGAALTAIAVGVGVGVGTAGDHGGSPSPMLGSAATFDTRRP